MNFIYIFFNLFLILFIPAMLVEADSRSSTGLKIFIGSFFVSLAALYVIGVVSEPAYSAFDKLSSYVISLLASTAAAARFFYLRWLKV